MRNTAQRSIANALAMLLLIMRFALPQRFVGILFRTTQQVVSDAVITVSEHLLKHFVPQHLGFTHITRENSLLRHTPGFLNELFCNELNQKIIIDGTTIIDS